MKRRFFPVLLSLLVLSFVTAQEEDTAPPDRSEDVDIAEVQITGHIRGQQLALGLDFEAETKRPQRRVLLIQGDAVLDTAAQPPASGRLDYDKDKQAYYLAWPRTGTYQVTSSFLALPQAEPDSPWRQTTLQVPHARIRRIKLISDRPDLEVQLPQALRVQRQTEQGQLVINAILGPRQPLVLRWKPQVHLADAKLVLSSQANTIVDVRAGLLALDVVFDFQVAQGKIESLVFRVPANLNVTALNGLHIRNWSLAEPVEGQRDLVVELSRPQDRQYQLYLQAETDVNQLPAEIEVPALEPRGGIRASGHLAVGTNSALQLVVLESAGLTQIDGAVFPRRQVPQVSERPIPQAKTFFYMYAGSRYDLRLAVDDIVPSFDVAGRMVTQVKEDDMLVEAELELDVRDAPIRQLEVQVPAGLVVALVQGGQVEDYHISENQNQDEPATVRVLFKQPVLGRTLVQLRLELGRGPLDQLQKLPALQVKGAKIQRGYVVVATEPGIEIDKPVVQNLRTVHTASVPLRVAEARFAYRYRQADWQLDLLARRKPASIRAEVFHLQSIGEALAYGSAVVNYLITGSPVDELSFRLAEGLENVEFVGRDVRRWQFEDGRWRVKLTRKIIGDYNLAVTYTQRYDADQPIRLGALHCEDIQTQTGYVVVTSHLDLRLQVQDDPGASPTGLLPIAMDELPADLRLLTSSPILGTYKYVTDPHMALLQINPYQRSDLLPVLLDIAAHNTKLAVHPDGRIESVTTVRYKVKNTTGQFLSLALPAGARVWAVSLIQAQANGQEQATRVAASHDQATGRLLIPLRRQSNPNDPTTLELEYGQVHAAQGRWRYQVDLDAPRCAVPMTYADWRIQVPDEWVIAGAGGNMQAQLAPMRRPGLAQVLPGVGRAWKRALRYVTRGETPFVVGGIALVLLVLCVIFRRVWLPELTVTLLLFLLLGTGIHAYQRGGRSRPGSVNFMNFTEAVSADPQRALQVQVALVPAWRQSITKMDLVVIPLVALGVLAWVIWRRRLGAVVLSLVLALGLYILAKIPHTWTGLYALCTWGAPVAALLWLVWRRGVLRRFRPAVFVPAVSVILLVLLLLLGGCADTGPPIGPLSERSLIERLELDLFAGKDHVELKYQLRISALGPTQFDLLDESAVLVTSPQPHEYVKLVRENGRHCVQVSRAGVYAVEASFLTPLPPAGEDQQRRIELPQPVALTNHVDLVVPDANVLIEAPQAVHLVHRTGDRQSTVEAMFTPGHPVTFTWRPKERQAAQEEVRFYARDVGLAHVTPGLLQVFHAVRLQIAQGQVDMLKLGIAPGETVTAVHAAHVGAWRFDPVAQQLEMRLTQPVTGVYGFTLVTQAAHAAVPYDLRLQPLVIEDAVNQHSILGLAPDPSVYIQVGQHPAVMNAQDYVRDNAGLLQAGPKLPREQITQAFRFDWPDDVVTGRVLTVQSELRSQEIARFNVEDDRLIYNSQWDINIAKAGRFDIELLLPAGYDIDTLGAEQVSHWDESESTDPRRVRVHFKRKLTGSVQLKLALSQPVTEMPLQLAVPRVTLAGALKHTGQLLVGSEQGVRLTVATRQGASEINPAELNQTDPGTLAFRLLRPDWQLLLQTELVQPRITAQCLHVAQVADGLVRHHHSLRYRLFHAGTKAFTLKLPPAATGVTLTGSGIARRVQAAPETWRIELAQKVYDRPYLLRVTYETRYDQAEGEVPLAPVHCQDAELQQGHVVVFATDRVELSADPPDASLRPAEVRNIPKFFGAGDLSGAAMCYRAASTRHTLTVRAQHHAAAPQIGADVRQTDIVTVVTETGQSINQVNLMLRVGTQRHLQTILPDKAVLWSLAVDGQPAQPSLRTNTGGDRVYLVPLPQQAADEVVVEMVYVTDLASGATDWAGVHQMSGPRFDLPLKQISWQIYVPEGFAYEDFGGTLTLDKNTITGRQIRRYNLQSYEQQLIQTNQINDQRAQQQQVLAQELAQKGLQTQARRALAKGYNFSRGNQALNEDIRVDLDNLLRQQVKVGLINGRGRLRQQTSGQAASPSQGPLPQPASDMSFSQQQAERLESSLGQADNENLDLITRRIIQAQEAAEGSLAQLQITMPLRGQVLRFDSPLQVEPAAEMLVSFNAQRQAISGFDPSIGYGLGLFVGLVIVSGGLGLIHARWDRLHEILRPVPAPAPVTPDTSAPSSDTDDDSNGPVSSEELV